MFTHFESSDMIRNQRRLGHKKRQLIKERPKRLKFLDPNSDPFSPDLRLHIFGVVVT